MKKILTLLLLASSTLVSAQEVVSTQGDSYVGASGSMDFTIGEVVINTETNGTNDITQGFHQPIWDVAGIEDYGLDFEANVFPNPMENYLNIKTSNYQDVTYVMYDEAGRLVAQDVLGSDLTIVEVSAFAKGSYSLALIAKDGTNLKTFKLVKVL